MDLFSEICLNPTLSNSKIYLNHATLTVLSLYELHKHKVVRRTDHNLKLFRMFGIFCEGCDVVKT